MAKVLLDLGCWDKKFTENAIKEDYEQGSMFDGLIRRSLKKATVFEQDSIVEERKTGKWIKNTNCIATVREPFYYQCSICECPVRSNNHKFCPNCGAEMRGSEND